jgi:sugar fermentation stimulation protein A
MTTPDPSPAVSVDGHPRPRHDGESARFVRRENRFVVIAERSTGDRVRAYLPNTARLTDVLVPDAPLIIVPNDAPQRRTRWTVTRVRDGAWVALVATVAADLVAHHMRTGGALPGWPPVLEVRREVTHGGHRFDLEVDLADARTGIVEVKSLSRSVRRTAPLSATPSSRGVAHLGALAALAAAGRPTAAVFVVQRPDVDVLDLTAAADPAWREAVRDARRRGVGIFAYRCAVTAHHVDLGDPLPVRDDPRT